jgi:hypothetical protein
MSIHAVLMGVAPSERPSAYASIYKHVGMRYTRQLQSIRARAESVLETPTVKSETLSRLSSYIADFKSYHELASNFSFYIRTEDPMLEAVIGIVAMADPKELKSDLDAYLASRRCDTRKKYCREKNSPEDSKRNENYYFNQF